MAVEPIIHKKGPIKVVFFYVLLWLPKVLPGYLTMHWGFRNTLIQFSRYLYASDRCLPASKDNVINMTIEFFKMISWGKAKFPHCLYILLTQLHGHEWIYFLSLLSESPNLTAYNIEINYETGCIGKFSNFTPPPLPPPPPTKKQKSKTKTCIQDHHSSEDRALCGISRFQSLITFIKNPNKGTTGALNGPLEYYYNIYLLKFFCRWSN